MRIQWKSDVLPLVGFYLLCLAWVAFCGKDLNWDQVNYHLYGPDLWLRSRWGQDYFAASVQSYLNPIGFVPFYWLVHAGTPDWLIAGILASLQFLNVVALWLLYKAVVPKSQLGHLPLALLACGLGLATPIFLMELGSSFNDPWVTLCVLAALLGAVTIRNPTHAAVLAGVLLGIGAGIKLTAGTFGIAMCLLLGWHWRAQRMYVPSIVRNMLAYCLACAAGFIVTHGAWSWLLWKNFNNPFFPFFNNIFRSAEFMPYALHDQRFLGEGWWGLFTLPFNMVKLQQWVYTETSAPDLRPAVLASVLLVAGVLAVFRRPSLLDPSSTEGSSRLYFVTGFVIVSYVLWGSSSRIGRYALPIWMLVGPLLVLWAIQLWRRRTDLIVLLGGILIIAQVTVFVQHGDTRWQGSTFSGPWFDMNLPPDLVNQPYTYVSTDLQSMAFLSSFVHPESSFANIGGQYTQPIGSNIRPELQRIMEKKKVIYLSSSMSPRPDEAAIRVTSKRLAPYGLALSGVCSVGRLKHDSSRKRGADVPAYAYMMFCETTRLSFSETAAAVARAEAFDTIFERIEQACAGTFEPRHQQTVINGDGRIRAYFNTNNQIMIEAGAVYSRAFRTISPVLLGTLDDLLRGESFQCPSPVIRRYLE